MYMKPVAKFESKINNVFSGIKEYVPIMFDEMHFCVVKATVHSILIGITVVYTIKDFKYRQGQSLEDDGPSENFEEFMKRITKKCN